MLYAFFCNQENTKNYEFLFRYLNSNLELDRQFKFVLKSSEKISDLATKIITAIENSIKRRIEHIKQQKLKLENDQDQDDKKINEIQITDIPKIQVNFIQNESQVNFNRTCKDLTKSCGELIFILNNEKYNVLINKPGIRLLTLPTCMFTNSLIAPSQYETTLVKKNSYIFNWYKSLDKRNWILVGEGLTYVTNDDDLNHFLKLECIPAIEGEGITSVAESEVQVVMFPTPCPFQNRHAFTKQKLTGKNFRVISYNILADHYCKSNNAKTVTFKYCDTEALSIDYRKQLIRKEIIGYNADIICLQEVDYKIYKTYFRPELYKFNFKGIYNPKDTKPEGLACFFNFNRFKRIRTLSIVIGKEVSHNRELEKLWKLIAKNKLLAQRLSAQNTILQILVLKSIENAEILLVANTHLYFHPEADDLRLLQTAISIKFVEIVIRQVRNKNNNKRISTIFCGDLNSTPESAVYKLFTTGNISEDDFDWNKNSNETTKTQSINLTHRKLFSSACGTPKYTNYTEDFKACLDYIFYEYNNLCITHAVPLLTEEEMSLYTALPSLLVPSDHVALIANFKWS